MLRTDILAGESIQTSVPILMVAQAIRPIQVRPYYWCVCLNAARSELMNVSGEAGEAKKARKAAGRIVAMVPVGILRKNVPAG